MANNRMYLIHRPTGLGAYLGKRMAGGWYDGQLVGANIQKLYDAVEPESGFSDDFVIVTERDDSLFPWNRCERRDDGILQFTTKCSEKEGL